MAERRVGTGAAAEGVVADDFAGANDADVGGVNGVDEGGVAGDPAALPADLGDGVVVHVCGAGEDGVGGEAKESPGAKLDSSSEVVAGGYEDFASAEERAAVDCQLNGGGIFGGAVALRAVVADVEEDDGLRRVDGFGFGCRECFDGCEIAECGDCRSGEKSLRCGLQETAACLVHDTNFQGGFDVGQG